MIISLAALADENSDKSKSSDWPQWRGTNRDSKSPATGVFKFTDGYGLKLAWKTTIGEGYSSVSIAGNRAVTMFADDKHDYIAAFDADNGSELWRYKTGPLYVGQGGSEDGPSSTPLIDGDVVYALGRKGKLFALDAATGKEIWARELVDKDKAVTPFHGFTTSPLLHNDMLIIETGGEDQNAISAYDKNSGELLWKNGQDQILYHSPCIANINGKDQVLCSGSNFLFGLDPQSGNKLWEYKHDGRGSSGNPVLLEGNKILVPHSFREAALIEVKEAEGAFSVDEVWRSRHIKQSFNVPVYHDGYFYGYSGRFITCVDAKTGETTWKSRPPGDGFLILVDNHLVVLTKKGTLHIAEASPEGYEEKANLPVFERLAWSPPSFANGRIYARSLSEIASVEITQVSQPISIVEAKKPPVAPNSQFAQWVKTVEAAGDKQALIDEFIQSQKEFPVIEGENLVHFVYHGEVKDLVITGDMFDQGVEENMKRIACTNFYYYTFKTEPDAHLGYQLVRNYEDRITDPKNPRTVQNFNGEESEFWMPNWDVPSHLKEPTGARGTLESIEFKSEILQSTRTLQVYLPNGYQSSNEKYPTVFVNYGRMAVDFGKTPTSLDNLITGGAIQPVIAVFIHPTRNRFQEYARNARSQYAQMIAEELVPFIDQKYRTKTTQEQRAIMGGDEGGYSAIYTAFKHPTVFGKVAGQSSHLHSAEGDELRAMVKDSRKIPVQFYLDWGKYDYRSESSDYNWADNNRNFVKILQDKGYTVKAIEVSEGFGWTSWRTRTDKILETFFPASK